MTTLGRAKSALLVIDVQNQVVPAEVLVRDLNASFSGEELPGRNAAAANVAELFN